MLVAELGLHGNKGWVTAHTAADTLNELSRDNTSELGSGVTATEAGVSVGLRSHSLNVHALCDDDEDDAEDNKRLNDIETADDERHAYHRQ